MKSLILKISIIVVIVFFVGLPLLLPRLITIKNVVCKTQYGSCSSEIEEAIAFGIKGKSLRQSKKAAAERIKGQFLIKDFSLQYQIPSLLRVNLIIRKPVFSLSNKKEQNSFALIDSDGYLLSTARTNNLPYLIVADTPLAIGEKLSPELIFASRLLLGIYRQYQIGWAEVEEGYFTSRLPNGIRIIAPLSGEEEVFLGSLSLIYSELNKENKDSKIGRISLIDLRFKNPILK